MSDVVVEKCILRIKRKLHELGTTDEKKIKYLKQLEDLPLTIDLLRQTSIGKAVNVLRKCNGLIGEIAKSLILQWKDLANSNFQNENATRKINTLNNFDHKAVMGENNYHNYHSSVRDTTNPHLTTNSRAIQSSPEEATYEELVQSTSSGKNDCVNSKISFEEMLVMPMMYVKKKKKNVDIKSKITCSKLAMPSLPEITLPDIHLDVPVTEYHPRLIPPPVIEKKKCGTLVKEDHEIVSRKSRGQMYSGKKQNGVSSLYEISMKVLMDNVESLYDTGGVPFVLLEPLLAKCCPSELDRLERYNPHFLEDSEKLWKTHCQREFRGHTPDTVESWKELFYRLVEEREVRLQKIHSKIIQSHATKVPERTVKLAYVSRTPKPGNHILRIQKRFGTDARKKELKERMEKEQKQEADVSVPFSSVPRRDRCAFRAPSSLSTTNLLSITPLKKTKYEVGTSGPSRLTPTPIRKKAKKPMMAAALKLLKKQKGRTSSQVIRK